MDKKPYLWYAYVKFYDARVKKPFAPYIILCNCEGTEQLQSRQEKELPMDLIVTKWIALEATAILARDKEEQLRERFPADLIDTARQFADQMSVKRELEIVRSGGESFTYILGEGGIFTALWKLAQEAGAGLEADLRKIPIRQETVEICEHFDINPYNALSGGSLLAAVPDGAAFMDALRREGIFSAMIGRLTDGNDRILWNDGNKRYLDRPQREELYRIYEKIGYRTVEQIN